MVMERGRRPPGGEPYLEVVAPAAGGESGKALTSLGSSLGSESKL
jgi:hypothetical protein